MVALLFQRTVEEVAAERAEVVTERAEVVTDVAAERAPEVTVDRVTGAEKTLEVTKVAEKELGMVVGVETAVMMAKATGVLEKTTAKGVFHTVQSTPLLLHLCTRDLHVDHNNFHCWKGEEKRK